MRTARDPLAGDHGRRVEPPGEPDLRTPPTAKSLAALCEGVGDELLDLLPLALGDEWAELRLRLQAVSDPQLVRLLDQIGEELLVDGALNVEPLDAGADLPAVRKCPPRGP